MSFGDRPEVPSLAWDELVNETQAQVIEWLVDPERHGSQRDLAARLGIHEATISKWKKDYLFRRAWDKRLADLNVAPDRIQRVIDSIYNAACKEDMKAAELYLKFVDRFTPKVQVQGAEDKKVAEMSDEELAKQLRQGIHLLEGGEAAEG